MKKGVARDPKREKEEMVVQRGGRGWGADGISKLKRPNSRIQGRCVTFTTCGRWTEEVDKGQRGRRGAKKQRDVKTEKLKNRLSHTKQRRKAKEKEGKCCKIERKTRKKNWGRVRRMETRHSQMRQRSFTWRHATIFWEKVRASLTKTIDRGVTFFLKIELNRYFIFWIIY